MALTRCLDCKTEISTQAKFCPKCGRPLSSSDLLLARLGKINLAPKHVVGIVVLLGLAGVCLAVTKSERTIEPPPLPATALEKELEAANRASRDFEERGRAEAAKTVFLARVRSVDPYGVRYVDVAVDKGSPSTIVVLVSQAWLGLRRNQRRSDAEVMWRVWVESVGEKANPDHWRLKIVDASRREVAGSRVLAGSLIWVEDD